MVCQTHTTKAISILKKEGVPVYFGEERDSGDISAEIVSAIARNSDNSLDEAGMLIHYLRTNKINLYHIVRNPLIKPMTLTALFTEIRKRTSRVHIPNLNEFVEAVFKNHPNLDAKKAIALKYVYFVRDNYTNIIQADKTCTFLSMAIRKINEISKRFADDEEVVLSCLYAMEDIYEKYLKKQNLYRDDAVFIYNTFKNIAEQYQNTEGFGDEWTWSGIKAP